MFCAFNITQAQKGLEVQLHIFSISPTDGDEFSTSRLGRLTPGKDSRYPFRWRLGRPKVGLDLSECEKISSDRHSYSGTSGN